MAEPTEVDVDPEGFRELAWSLGLEADGRKLQRDFSKNLRVALEPAAQEARSGILAMGSTVQHEGESLRQGIASGIKTGTRLSGDRAGARVSAKKTGAIRGFKSAPKRTNQPGGWRHPVHGRDVWVHQVGRPDWFDGPMEANRTQYRLAVRRAMDDAAERITRGR